MNQCYGCTTCESADKPLEGFIKNLPLETSHHRVEGQSTKCAFGLQGVCLSALFKRTVQNHTGCPERNLRCKCRYDRCEKLSSCGSVRLGVLYPCRREYGKKCEKCSAEKEWDKRRRSIK